MSNQSPRREGSVIFNADNTQSIIIQRLVYRKWWQFWRPTVTYLEEVVACRDSATFTDFPATPEAPPPDTL